MTKSKLGYHWAPVPVEMLNDDRLNPVDITAWGIMWDASRDRLCTISEQRLGQRLRRSPDTARRVIRKLAATGWIEVIDHGNGKCRDYRLLTTSTIARGSDIKTSGAYAGGLGATPSSNAPHPPHPYPKTPSTNAALPRSYLDTSLKHETRESQSEKDDKAKRGQHIAKLKQLATDFFEERRSRIVAHGEPSYSKPTANDRDP